MRESRREVREWLIDLCPDSEPPPVASAFQRERSSPISTIKADRWKKKDEPDSEIQEKNPLMGPLFFPGVIFFVISRRRGARCWI